jgi:O-acetyl-ADP-ribose deacetylase
MKREVRGVTIDIKTGDIVSQPDMDAVVNAANARLLPGGGVAGAIHRAAGPGLAEECAPLAPITPGEAVITGAHNMANKYVIHCLGPVYGRDKPEEKLLASCYSNALKLADEKNIASIAFPSISTGAFGYPVREASKTAAEAVSKTLPELKSVKIIRFVLHSGSDLEVYEEAFSKI